MIALSKKLRALALAAVAVIALAAVAAAPAMAEQVPAKASATNIGISATNITVKKNGAEAKNCELAEKYAAGPILSGAFAQIRNIGDTYLQTRLTCTGSTKFSLNLYFSELLYDTSTGQYLLRAEPELEGPFDSPWGQYHASRAYVPVGSWTNGSGTTNSTVTFPETTVGIHEPGGAKISFSGTFTVKTGSGGLITLSH